MSPDGDTAEKGVLKPMVEEGGEVMGEESEAEVRAPNMGAGGSHPQADLGAEGPEVAEEEGEVVKVRREPKGPTKKEKGRARGDTHSVSRVVPALREGAGRKQTAQV